eukprot:403374075
MSQNMQGDNSNQNQANQFQNQSIGGNNNMHGQNQAISNNLKRNQRELPQNSFPQTFGSSQPGAFYQANSDIVMRDLEVNQLQQNQNPFQQLPQLGGQPAFGTHSQQHVQQHQLKLSKKQIRALKRQNVSQQQKIQVESTEDQYKHQSANQGVNLLQQSNDFVMHDHSGTQQQQLEFENFMRRFETNTDIDNDELFIDQSNRQIKTKPKNQTSNVQDHSKFNLGNSISNFQAHIQDQTPKSMITQNQNSQEWFSKQKPSLQAKSKVMHSTNQDQGIPKNLKTSFDPSQFNTKDQFKSKQSQPALKYNLLQGQLSNTFSSNSNVSGSSIKQSYNPIMQSSNTGSGLAPIQHNPTLQNEAHSHLYIQDKGQQLLKSSANLGLVSQFQGRNAGAGQQKSDSTKQLQEADNLTFGGLSNQSKQSQMEIDRQVKQTAKKRLNQKQKGSGNARGGSQATNKDQFVLPDLVTPTQGHQVQGSKANQAFTFSNPHDNSSQNNLFSNTQKTSAQFTDPQNAHYNQQILIDAQATQQNQQYQSQLFQNFPHQDRQAQVNQSQNKSQLGFLDERKKKQVIQQDQENPFLKKNQSTSQTQELTQQEVPRQIFSIEKNASRLQSQATFSQQTQQNFTQQSQQISSQVPLASLQQLQKKLIICNIPNTNPMIVINASLFSKQQIQHLNAFLAKFPQEEKADFMIRKDTNEN